MMPVSALATSKPATRPPSPVKKKRAASPRKPKVAPPKAPSEAPSAHATGANATSPRSSSTAGGGSSTAQQPKPSRSTAATLASARGRLERDSVELLSRQKKELEDECERLRGEVTKAAESFKLAWQTERAAHQHDLETAAVARNAAIEEAHSLRESVRAARDALDRATAASQAEAAQLREAVDRSRAQLEKTRREGGGQLRSLQRQLAQLRAQKGELCEEFAAKLAAITGGQEGQTGGPLGNSGCSCTAELGSGGSSSGGAAAGATAGHAGGALLPAMLAGYEGLSIDSAQLQSAIVSAPTPSAGGSGSSAVGSGAVNGTASGGLGAEVSGGIAFGMGRPYSVSVSAAEGKNEGKDKEGAQKRAIDSMKTAQQLRSAEADLEKASRLLATKSRRVGELEREVEVLRMGALTKDAELAKRANVSAC